MQILSLYLRNFRNYEETFVPFSPGINLIVGENGEGKTNLLEALYIFVTGRSFRTPHLADLISFGKTHFYLELRFVKNEIEQVLKIYVEGKQRKIYHNFTSISHLSALFGILLGVVLSPQDSDLIQGHPSARRQFLDLHISQENPLYLHHLSRYMRAMKQRNFLLRKKERKSIEIWEEEMARSAAFLTLVRQKVIQELHLEAAPFQSFISNNKDALSLSFRNSALNANKREIEEIIQFYIEQHQKHRQREFELGYTLSGPHKDDIDIFLGEREAKSFGSIGQIRSIAMSLRLSEWERFKKRVEEIPLFFIDDVGMSLDEEREKSLYSLIPKLGQAFLTSPRLLTFDHPSHVIWVNQGKVSSDMALNC